MIIKDFYGTFKIKEPVIIELIKSKPMQRIKRISQQGMLKQDVSVLHYSRYEHSIGVMLLLKKLGAGTEEQVAGLLHDVSHTAFSHSTDMLFGSYETQGMQDSLHPKYINNGQIAKILKKHGFKPSRIANLKLFKLLETEAPNLCADRLDYSLRDLHHLKIKIKQIIKHLTLNNGEIIFDSKKQASSYARKYMKLQMNFYASKQNMTRVKILTTALRDALKHRAITKKDILYGVDGEVIKKIKKSNALFAKQLLTALSKKNYKTINNGNTTLKAKFRYVDPKFSGNGSIQRLTGVDPSYRKLIKKDRIKCVEGYKVGIVLENGKVL